ncbi:MAG: hypothetical protein K8U03_19960 [Planctomycetia bacterium]|nr:hypothetical protein [Planctomycetia bacterium]
MSDLFDQLARTPVPPPPAALDRRVHERLNYILLALHVVEFAIRVVPYGLAWFARGILGWLHVASTGTQIVESRPREIIDDNKNNL